MSLLRAGDSESLKRFDEEFMFFQWHQWSNAHDRILDLHRWRFELLRSAHNKAEAAR